MGQFIKNIAQEFDFSRIMEALSTDNAYRDVVKVFDDNGGVRTDLPEGSYFRELSESLYKAGYKDPVWNGLTFYPHTHFDESIVYFLDNMFGTICTQCWINKVSPGKIVAPHRDWDDREDLLKEYGTAVRYSIHLGEPDPGHVFWLENYCHYLEEHGNLYKWNDPLSIHGGSNSGLTNKYLLVYRAIIPYEVFNFEYVWQTDNDSVKIRLDNGTII